jgi:hypothetical protein
MDWSPFNISDQLSPRLFSRPTHGFSHGVVLVVAALLCASESVVVVVVW